MKIINGLCLALCVLAISACESTQKTPGGVVPDQFLSYAQEFVGKYDGKFDRLAVSLDITMTADHKLIVTPLFDLLDSTCGSQFGELEQINYKADDKTKQVTLVGADFAFDAGNCWPDVQGRHATLSFSKNKQGQLEMQIVIYAHEEQPWDCRFDMRGRQFCNEPSQPLYLFGKLQKH